MNLLILRVYIFCLLSTGYEGYNYLVRCKSGGGTVWGQKLGSLRNLVVSPVMIQVLVFLIGHFVHWLASLVSLVWTGPNELEFRLDFFFEHSLVGWLFQFPLHFRACLRANWLAR